MTPLLAATATSQQLEAALEQLPNVEDVQVSYSSPGSTISTLCDDSGGSSVSNNIA